MIEMLGHEEICAKVNFMLITKLTVLSANGLFAPFRKRKEAIP